MKVQWTDAEEARLRALRVEQGLSIPACAKALGRSVNAVRARLAVMGVRVKPKVIWTPELLDQVEAWRAQGENWSVIARRTGRSPHACRTALSQRCRGGGDGAPPAPEGAPALDRARERLERLTRAGMARTAALAMIEREMPDARLRGCL